VTRKAIEILLVEDNPGDVRLLVEALKETRVPSRLHLAEDGVQAMSFLRKKGPHSGVPRPDLVLLDLNLPNKDGREVLAEIKDDAKLKSIPVVVLTTSQAEQDVLRSYQLHANCTSASRSASRTHPRSSPSRACSRPCAFER
jgi:CheY-like chemotaxis protein